MALPKLNDTPKYSMTIPSMGETVKFRPFLVKEEKVLMLAMETEDQQQILNAIIETLSSCIQQEIDVNKLTTFDVEYMFVTLRGKSVGETIDLKMKCKSCQHENEYKLKIDDLKIHMPKISNIIELSEDISIEMSYPTYTMVGSLGGEDVTEADLIFNILANSITKIMTEEEVFIVKDESRDDVSNFIDSMNTSQFSKVQEWIEAMPKLSHTVAFDCVKCGEKHSELVEGMQNFFT